MKMALIFLEWNERPVYVYVSWNAMRFKVLKFDYMMTDESKYGHNHAGRSVW